ncbi:hypothetical protein KTE45_07675 [Burkholderia multivorans]|uniref:hypothetical protein n=1 Tax=Burkholderia multivorans TaxID=87883 RepID=UPI001C2686E1|nr:hypothetical protein [Burkholderia multivorans]MBU9518355.1 hypothetical protein [Burkholderia multivorans]
MGRLDAALYSEALKRFVLGLGALRVRRAVPFFIGVAILVGNGATKAFEYAAARRCADMGGQARLNYGVNVARSRSILAVGGPVAPDAPNGAASGKDLDEVYARKVLSEKRVTLS